MNTQQKKNNFVVFILTHGRPDNVITFKTLQKQGYTGPIVFIVDNEDKEIKKYKRNFGKENIYIFDKEEVAQGIDEANGFGNRNTIVYARNVCFTAARELGYKYFVELDDDYDSFSYKFAEKEVKIKDMNLFFQTFVDFHKATGCLSVALAQGGDQFNGKYGKMKLRRKCMNSFFCSVSKPFEFVGAINEDVNTYVTTGSRGGLFFTFTGVQLHQKQTQTQAGGISDFYLTHGTYIKSFTPIMMHPSSVKIMMLHTSNARLHHQIIWKNTVPRIIRETHKKGMKKC